MASRQRERRQESEAEEGVHYGQRLAAIRRSRGLSQAELAEAIGVTVRVISYYERESDWSIAGKIPRMADALGVSADEILGRNGSAPDTGAKTSRLWKTLRLVEELPEKDRRAVLRHIRALARESGILDDE